MNIWGCERVLNLITCLMSKELTNILLASCLFGTQFNALRPSNIDLSDELAQIRYELESQKSLKVRELADKKVQEQCEKLKSVLARFSYISQTDIVKLVNCYEIYLRTKRSINVKDFSQARLEKLFEIVKGAFEKIIADIETNLGSGDTLDNFRKEVKDKWLNNFIKEEQQLFKNNNFENNKKLEKIELLLKNPKGVNDKDKYLMLLEGANLIINYLNEMSLENLLELDNQRYKGIPIEGLKGLLEPDNDADVERISEPEAEPKSEQSENAKKILSFLQDFSGKMPLIEKSNGNNKKITQIVSKIIENPFLPSSIVVDVIKNYRQHIVKAVEDGRIFFVGDNRKCGPLVHPIYGLLKKEEDTIKERIYLFDGIIKSYEIEKKALKDDKKINLVSINDQDLAKLGIDKEELNKKEERTIEDPVIEEVTKLNNEINEVEPILNDVNVSFPLNISMWLAKLKVSMRKDWISWFGYLLVDSATSVLLLPMWIINYFFTFKAKD